MLRRYGPGQGHRRRRRARARRQPRQRLPPLPEQGGAARRGDRALAGARLRRRSRRSPTEDGPAPERLRRWFDLLIASQAAEGAATTRSSSPPTSRSPPKRARSSRRTSRRWSAARPDHRRRRRPGRVRGRDPATAARAVFDATPLPQPRPRRRVVGPRDRGCLRGRVVADPGGTHEVVSPARSRSRVTGGV